jgi:hypothetical protein
MPRRAVVPDILAEFQPAQQWNKNRTQGQGDYKGDHKSLNHLGINRCGHFPYSL